uniref:C-type lectin domain-containing protein n=1 Tax=Gouania willdenowi TaxID=441366 RepID=A0A8C5HGU5_GOUWI
VKSSKSLLTTLSFEFVLILMSFSGTFGKYVYVEESRSWDEAQQYCRTHFIDLAPINNEYDNMKLAESYNIPRGSWIGLMKPNATQIWMWSGGARVEQFFWATGGEVKTAYIDAVGAFSKGNWYIYRPDSSQPFFCFNVILVEERKTWEKALEYCREHHSDLASVASETEMMLIQSKLKNHVPSSMVWIGLHSFQKGWLWVDGQPMTYNAWSSNENPVCPPLEMQCAALKTSVWEAHNCYDELPFICY